MILSTAYTKCPECKTNYYYTDMVSGNTIGAEFWSDGFYFGPMLHDAARVSKCPSCQAFFWIPDQIINEPTENLELTELENPFRFINQPGKEIKFVKEVLKSGIINTVEKEIYIRVKFWQAINHLMRKYVNQDLFTKITQKFFKSDEYESAKKQYSSIGITKVNNLIRLGNLIKSLKSDDMDYVQFAEIYRESGDFNKAMIFCYKAESNAQADANRINLMKQHIQNKNKMVYKL
jgi:hypothetical protein